MDTTIATPNVMKKMFLMPLVLAAVSASAQEVLFQDDFDGKLGPGWFWVREHREAWRVTAGGLEVRIEPGNMWGSQNNARNVLVRPAPEVAGEIEVAVTFENKPTNQYEQADLVWYYDDSNMVKLGQELVDGKLSVVMGREESDKTRTIAIVPLGSPSVRVRFRVKANEIHGQFLTPGAKEWQEAGICSLPAPVGKPAKLSIQCYQGPAAEEHWVRITQFRVTKI